MLLPDKIRYLSLILSSSLLSFLIAIFIAPYFIKLLKKLKLGKKIRENGADGKMAPLFRALHLKKEGTPTMGGILVWGTTLLVVFSTRFLSYLGFIKHSLINRKETYLPLFALISVALLGALDDYLNIKEIGKNKGINIKPKVLWLSLFSILGSLWFYFKLEYNQIHLPLIGNFYIGWWYIPLFIFIILATSNSVNITDGLDGLAGGLLIIAFASFSAIAFAQGLFILSAFCGIICGSLLAFLWFNIPPARFYMGDTGSLSLGAVLGVIAMLTDSVFVLPLIGFIFVMETLSVMIQLISKKLFHRKVFLIAPFHHHLEAKSWTESQITMRFWIIGGVIATMGLILRLIDL